MQGTESSTVSKQESLTLIRNMIRIAISSICYLRQIFPDECFRTRQYGNIEIHQLHCGEKDDKGNIDVLDEEAFTVTQWLQQGVFKALDVGYLSVLTFIIFTKNPTTDEDIILETYEFKISYPDKNKNASINGTQLYSKDSVKAQAGQFIRALIDFCGTLDTIPDDRWITLQIQYTDWAPKEYEPEFFESTSQSLLMGKTFPLKVNVGEIKTREVGMKMRFAGLESLFVEDIPQFATASHDGGSILLAQRHENHPKQTECHRLVENVSAMTIAGDAKQMSGILDQEAYEAVKDFISAGNHPQVRPFSTALSITHDLVRDIFERLCEEGVLEKKRIACGFRYEVKPGKVEPSKTHRKRGLDQEAEPDENSFDHNIVSEPTLCTPTAPKNEAKTRKEVANSSTRKKGAQQNAIPSSQVSDVESCNLRFGKVKDPVFAPKAKRLRQS